jgi:hypothetical protein
MMITWVRVLMLALVFAAAGSVVEAQTVDLRQPALEVLTWLANILIVAMTAVATVAVRFLFARFGLANSQLEQNLNDRLSDIIHKGIDFALASAQNEVQKRGSGLEAVKFDNYFISIAASYVAERAPQILKRFSVTQEKLEEMIWARIPAYAQIVPVEGGAKTPETVKQVNQATGGPNVAAPAPVVVTPKAETPLPPARTTSIFGETAPDTGS